MNEVPFHLTRGGRAFFESHVPELLRQLAKLNANVEALTAAVYERDEPEFETDIRKEND